MTIYDTLFSFDWFKSEPPLPSHLPRLLLHERFHPRFVHQCPVTQSLLPTLSLVDWEQLPTTLAQRPTTDRTIPLAAYIGSYLVKLERQIPNFGALRRFLREHPALIWTLGFPLVKTKTHSRFDIEASLPSQRHFSKKLSQIPNAVLQTLLDSQVQQLLARFGPDFGDVIAIDTKHILAWVQENNPKQYIKEGRHDKERQPAGDPDCKLGCKRRRNQITPTEEGEPVKKSVGEFYWGYASGVAATKLPDVGEFVLAELTQTFDCSDLSYFFPLMAAMEERLGRRPRYGTMDAAYDAFYTYDYFHSPDHDGFAAIPLRKINEVRQFSKDGLPLCAANLPMPCKGTFVNRTSFVQHHRGRHVCPLLFPEPTGESCPIDHVKWPKGGCKLTLPTAAGARIRYQLDRDSAQYKEIYKQRTATERIFSQAVNLGIERPKLRNREAIANQNTLTYLLINLRAMLRLDD